MQSVFTEAGAAAGGGGGEKEFFLCLEKTKFALFALDGVDLFAPESVTALTFGCVPRRHWKQVNAGN